jgi:metastasis-associated protein MTA
MLKFFTHNFSVFLPPTGPMLCRDEMEDWSASEANLFEEAIEKYGKDFNDIRKDFLPWKGMKNIIEYFFMWKTTDRYVQQKRIKALEAESKLKQVFVPNYTNKSTRLNGSNGEIIIRGKDCDAYPNLSKFSWAQYKKYGKFIAATVSDDAFILDKSSLSTAARLAQLRPGLIIEPGSPATMLPTGMPGMGGPAPGMGGTPNSKSGSGKTRPAFYLRTTPLMRAARRVCTGAKLRHHARKAGKPIDIKAMKVEAGAKMTGYSEKRVRTLNSFTPKTRVNMEVVVKRLGQGDDGIQEWLILTPKNQLPQPEKEFYPRPPKRTDGSYIYERIPPSSAAAAAAATAAAAAAAAATITTQPAQLLYKKRTYEDKPVGGLGGLGGQHTEGLPAMKMQRLDGRTNIVQPKGRVATLTRIQGGQRQVISWMDAPDDVYYKATAITKKLRKKLPVVQLRRAARKPFKKVITIPGAITPIITPPLSVVPLSIPQSFPQSIVPQSILQSIPPQSMPATIPAVSTN